MAPEPGAAQGSLAAERAAERLLQWILGGALDRTLPHAPLDMAPAH
jgi:hypothetical protein